MIRVCWRLRGRVRNSHNLSGNRFRYGNHVEYDSWAPWKRSWRRAVKNAGRQAIYSLEQAAPGAKFTVLSWCTKQHYTDGARPQQTTIALLAGYGPSLRCTGRDRGEASASGSDQRWFLSGVALPEPASSRAGGSSPRLASGPLGSFRQPIPARSTRRLPHSAARRCLPHRVTRSENWAGQQQPLAAEEWVPRRWACVGWIRLPAPRIRAYMGGGVASNEGGGAHVRMTMADPGGKPAGRCTTSYLVKYSPRVLHTLHLVSLVCLIDLDNYKLMRF